MKAVACAVAGIGGVDRAFVGKEPVVDAARRDEVPEKKQYLAVRIDVVNIVLHAALVAVIENDDPFCLCKLFCPAAPEQMGAGQMQHIEHLVDEIAQAASGNAEGRADKGRQRREKVELGALKDEQRIGPDCARRVIFVQG